MVLLMSKQANILLIVEGAKLEPNFFQKVAELYSLNVKIYPLKTNIYPIYHKLKELSFNADVKDVLRELLTNKEDLEILDEKFAYTYLIFDCDAHHGSEKNTKSAYETVIGNLSKLQEMVGYFTDETDTSRGKLYINYPMMESYRDCDDFFDDTYKDRVIDVTQLVHYKEFVSKKKLANYRIDDLQSQEYELLIKMNLYKLNHICEGKWSAFDYEDYLNMSNAHKVFEKQEKLVKTENYLSVLNTSLFFSIDFFGNQSGYFDKVINKEK